VTAPWRAFRAVAPVRERRVALDLTPRDDFGFGNDAPANFPLIKHHCPHDDN
jgi:hypothetical protein